MRLLETAVRNIKKPGLVWTHCTLIMFLRALSNSTDVAKIIPVAFRLAKLEIMCIVIDALIDACVLLEELESIDITPVIYADIVSYKSM